MAKVRPVRLREIRESDLDLITAHENVESDPWNAYAFRASNQMHRRFAADGLLGEGSGMLGVTDEGGQLIGSVGWHSVQHGPTPACRALNIGISIFPEHRGQGYGTAAQRALADYLFSTTLIERVEASTDVDNHAEQPALETAGYVKEGVIRHAQFRGGAWHDAVSYSRLRGD